MTPKSLTTVTPRAVWVKGPRARSSLIMAMADAGDRAMAMVPASMEMEILAASFISWAKGINSSRRNMETLISKKVTIT